MSERVQIGPAVNAKLWKRLREDVKARKGTVRGNLGTELDNAIRQYLRDGPTPAERKMLDRLERIEANLGTLPADGGADTSHPEPHTHAPTEKPAANAATEKKVAYLAECVLDREVPNTREITSIPRSVLVETVKDEYGFRSDTARRYVEELIDHFDLRDHPQADGVLVTAEREAELIEQQSEQAKADAEESLA